MLQLWFHHLNLVAGIVLQHLTSSRWGCSACHHIFGHVLCFHSLQSSFFYSNLSLCQCSASLCGCVEITNTTVKACSTFLSILSPGIFLPLLSAHVLLFLLITFIFICLLLLSLQAVLALQTAVQQFSNWIASKYYQMPHLLISGGAAWIFFIAVLWKTHWHVFCANAKKKKKKQKKATKDGGCEASWNVCIPRIFCSPWFQVLVHDPAADLCNSVELCRFRAAKNLARLHLWLAIP